MSYPVLLHPSVVKYLDCLSEDERKRCYISLKKLSNDPYKPRAGCDIKKLSGKKDSYRLRAGSHRFLGGNLHRRQKKYKALLCILSAIM